MGHSHSDPYDSTATESETFQKKHLILDRNSHAQYPAHLDRGRHAPKGCVHVMGGVEVYRVPELLLTLRLRRRHHSSGRCEYVEDRYGHQSGGQQSVSNRSYYRSIAT